MPGRTISILWFVAAFFALVAIVIRTLAGGPFNWAVAAGGLFCVVMGITMWRRQPPAS